MPEAKQTEHNTGSSSFKEGNSKKKRRTESKNGWKTMVQVQKTKPVETETETVKMNRIKKEFVMDTGSPITIMPPNENICATAIARWLRADDLFERAQEYWVLQKCAQAHPIACGTSKYTFLSRKPIFFAKNPKMFRLLFAIFSTTNDRRIMKFA